MESDETKKEGLTELHEMQDENTRWLEQLTNKNKEYMIKLNRMLESHTTISERTRLFHQMLPTLLEEQAKGVTARQLYGTVTDQAQSIIQIPEADKEGKMEERSEDWKLFLDSALMLGGLFAIVQGISGFVDAKSAQGGAMGIVSLLLNFLIGGVVGLLMTKYAPKKGDQNGLGKYLFVSTVAMLVWVVIMMAVVLAVPPSINVMLPASVIFGAGIVSIIAKFILKKQLNIKGTLM